jgi:3-phytase
VLIGSAGNTWILGTNKRQGLHVYALDGRELHHLDRGRLNNVDAFPLAPGQYLVAASNRTHGTLDLFRANVDANRIEFAAAVPLAVNDPYGVCMGKLPDGTLAAVVGGTDGGHQVWAIDTTTLAHRLLREFRLASQTEGCVYDAPTRRLFVGEEARGVWAIDVMNWSPEPFATTASLPLVPDVEGMDIYRSGDDAWLVVSSQGNDSFVVYSLATAQPVLAFRVGANRAAGIDGASETDGLAVSSQPLPGYPRGVLVVQDGRKRAPAGTQNFKVIDWREVEALLKAKAGSPGA